MNGMKVLSFGSHLSCFVFVCSCFPFSAFFFVTAAAGAAQGTPTVKPKRKKPGTAVKRKVQPIAVDAKGNYHEL